MKEEGSKFGGLARHFVLCLELNLRSRQAFVYGYLVPVLFLVAFASVFRAEIPALYGQMGQILTITILGGACFGLPTTLVSERERGIWRRYRLLPVATGSLVGGMLAARLVIVVSAAAVQVAVAHFGYHTPLPANPVQTAAGVAVVCVSFMGLGLLVAALADDVPAVQAIGQCLFLPMIMVGGVGIPLVALPDWAQRASGFMPGRYAVEILQLGYSDPRGIGHGAFDFLALAVIGASAAIAGVRLFRWESRRNLGRATWAWLGIALAGWVAIGVSSAATGRLTMTVPPDAGFGAVSDSQIESITYEDLPGDFELVSRLARPMAESKRDGALKEFSVDLRSWGPGRVADEGQSARNLLSLAGIGDVSQNTHEGEIARLIFDELRSRLGDEHLRRVLAWIILYPDAGAVLTSAPEMGFRRQFTEAVIRQRVDLYARKFLGKLRGKIRD